LNSCKVSGLPVLSPDCQQDLGFSPSPVTPSLPLRIYPWLLQPQIVRSLAHPVAHCGLWRCFVCALFTTLPFRRSLCMFAPSFCSRHHFLPVFALHPIPQVQTCLITISPAGLIDRYPSQFHPPPSSSGDCHPFLFLLSPVRPTPLSPFPLRHRYRPSRTFKAPVHETPSMVVTVSLVVFRSLVVFPPGLRNYPSHLSHGTRD